MINTSNKEKLLVTEKNSILLDFDSSSSLTETIVEWDLHKLRTIKVTHSLEDDEVIRNDINKRRLVICIFLGALFGLAMGHVFMFVITAFALYMCSSRKNLNAQIDLIFSDDSHLSVEVNESEYNQLKKIYEAQSALQNPVAGPATITRTLTLKGADHILALRAIESSGTTTTILCFIPTFFVLTACLIELARMLVSSLHSRVFLNATEPFPELFVPLFDFDWISSALLLAIFTLISRVIWGRFSVPKIENFLKNDEERGLYNRLKKSNEDHLQGESSNAF